MLVNQRQAYHDVQGEVFYNSLTPNEMQTHYRGDLQVYSIIPILFHYLIS